MSKRTPLSERRAQDRRGLDAILGGAEEPGREEMPSPSVPAVQRVEKVTLYVRPDQVMSLEEIQLQQRRRTGKKPDKSDLVQEALDLLIQKYSKTE
jgi:hypothetical protein